MRIISVTISKHTYLQGHSCDIVRWCFTFVLAAVVCAACIPFVKVNYSLTDYLPKDSESVVALDGMKSAFGGLTPNACVYVEGIDLAQTDELSQTFAQIDGISDVMWLGSVLDTHTLSDLQDSDTVSSWKTDEGYLFQMVVDSNKGSDALAQVREGAEAIGTKQVSLEGDAVNVASAQESTSREVAIIMVVAVIIIALILLFASHAWFEPVIFLTVIGIAILLNMGTNLVMGQIKSFVRV